jgi:hypothetical protein
VHIAGAENHRVELQKSVCECEGQRKTREGERKNIKCGNSEASRTLHGVKLRSVIENSREESASERYKRREIVLQ